MVSCKKSLQEKPDSSLVIPKTAQEMASILDNSSVMNITPALAQISSDDYYLTSPAIMLSLRNTTSKNAYSWQPEIYQGEVRIPDWVNPYRTVFYANSILDILQQQDISKDTEKQVLKGWALFSRSYAFYSLLCIFANAYDATTPVSDLGIPLKLSANIDEQVPRSSLKECYDRIINDLILASGLLQQDIIPTKRNRPSKVAAFALLARIYLSMRDYEQAGFYADKALTIYPRLTDYNTLLSSATAFTYQAEETIFFTMQETAYQDITTSVTSIAVDSTVVKSYGPNDLRFNVYYNRTAAGNYTMRLTTFPFTGLANDEMYLIKAESLARRGLKDQALLILNELLRSRTKTGFFVPVTASDSDQVLEKILIERRKSLIWRSLRWTDLRRLNKEGKNIELKRKLGDLEFTLAPNSPLYVLPIPDDEIALSGITQNKR
jgi:tetratricopeptide (TPR) repeat protein